MSDGDHTILARRWQWQICQGAWLTRNAPRRMLSLVRHLPRAKMRPRQGNRNAPHAATQTLSIRQQSPARLGLEGGGASRSRRSSCSSRRGSRGEDGHRRRDGAPLDERTNGPGSRAVAGHRGPPRGRAPRAARGRGGWRFRYELLKPRREALDLTVTEIGAKIGVEAWTIARWEDGTSLPLLTHLPAIVTHYVLSEADLFEETEGAR